MCEIDCDQGEKVFVIRGAYTVIQPTAMMIETMDTFVTRATVLSLFLDSCLADLTSKVTFTCWYWLSIKN